MGDRIERLAANVQEFKKQNETALSNKVEKSDYQMNCLLKLGKLEKFNFADISVRLDQVAQTQEHFVEATQDAKSRIVALERSGATKEQVTKNLEAIDNQKLYVLKYGDEIHHLRSEVYKSNTYTLSSVEEMKKTLTEGLAKLSRDKSDASEAVLLMERIQKLELNTRDNKDLMDDALGGAELNAIVKRVILGLEDKIMVLMKKVDVLEQGLGQSASSPRGAVPFKRDASPLAHRKNSENHSTHITAEERLDRDLAKVQGLDTDVSAVSAEVVHLKQ